MKKHISSLYKLGVRSLPANYGPLKNANANARVKGPCGDMMEIWLEIDKQFIRHAMFITDVCHLSLACGAMTAWLAEDKSISEGSQLTPDEVYKAAGEWVETHCALLSVNTLRAALDNYQQQKKQVAYINHSSDLSHKYHT
jgi:nitrogen fixation protein NifU and related proteins